MSKLKVNRVIMFKHGVSYFILDGKMKGSGTFELEFKIKEMNDILKSLFVLDTSEKGYISSISYDAALETSQLLESVMLDIPDTDSFSSLVTQIKGAQVNLVVGGSEKVTGTIMGLESRERLNKEGKISEKMLILMKDDGILTKIPFVEIGTFEIVNEDLKKDLKFFLDTIIAGKKKDAKKIVINCESGGDNATERAIIVSYIRESPIWKTSYRLIMSKQQALENKCLLSGWCMVENTTNNDWEDIELSLVAGMPVSFVYDFFRPIFIDRPVINPPRVLSAKPAEIEEGFGVDDFIDYDEAEKMAFERSSLKKAKMMAPAKPMAAPPPAPSSVLRGAIAGGLNSGDLSTKLKQQTQTTAKDLGELFEYNISNLVTIKRKNSALVPILTEEIKAKKILMYNINENEKNPNACLEITNNTNLTLERGPCTIIYDNNLAGEAIVPFLNKGDTRLLNYAVEQAVIVEHEEKSKSQNVHRIQISSSYCYEYYYTDLHTTYKIKNKKSEDKELYLDHPKKSGYIIEESATKPEETPNYWRFTLKLKPNAAISFKIHERKENYTSYYIYNYSKDDLLEKVAFYIKKQFIDESVEQQLKAIGELIGTKQDLESKKSKLENEKYEMTEEQSRLRENISVLKDSTQEAKLREKYVAKFSAQETRFESISKEIKKLEDELKKIDLKINEQITHLKVK
ncbi:MAG: hypothetical protein JW891_01615 [Candidatus Lokiarchaeota archaeon]|nr:hypothetical protein [Candidatus Lokiarchaeota archaeon]